jgi:hypothetical protein
VAEETIRQILPTAMGFAAREAIAALGNHRIATAPLLRRAGLSEHDPALAENHDPASHRSRKLSSSTTPQRRSTTARSDFNSSSQPRLSREGR